MLSAASAHLSLFRRQLPRCSITCTSIQNTFGCPAVTDIACICQRQEFVANLVSCVRASCAAQDVSAVLQAEANICNAAGAVLATQGTSQTSGGSSTSNSQTTNTQTSTNAPSNTSTDTNHHTDPPNVGAIAGGTVAGVVCLVLVGLMLWDLHRRRSATARLAEKSEIQYPPMQARVHPYPYAADEFRPRAQHGRPQPAVPAPAPPVSVPPPPVSVLPPPVSALPPPISAPPPLVPPPSHDDEHKAPLVLRWEPPPVAAPNPGVSQSRERELEEEVQALRAQVSALSPPSYDSRFGDESV
ncbi:hypothetical protein C8J57DRAFT_216276 [Mycena rebaudengoi]|nr:hypothetical protein C8J57DRAFT_216276 [Mycena rebaudengoi]